MRRFVLTISLMLCVGVPSAEAVVVTREIPYEHDGVSLQGYLAYDDTLDTQRPGVLVVHEWKGLGRYAKWRAEELVKLGYIAFAIDMYGKGVYAADHKEAAQLSGLFREDRHFMRERGKAGLEVLRNFPMTDPNRIAAIGYCFGGTTVLELARSGADIRGVVSFHGALDTPSPEDAKNVMGEILVCHGADDPFVPRQSIEIFLAEMGHSDVDHQVNIYGGAVHSFTVPEAGSDPVSGAAYHPQADRRSWEAMKTFLLEVLE